jgi:TatD DNase family protein
VLTDTHCHLDMVDGRSSSDLVERARAAGVGTMVTVGVDLASSAECVQTAAALDGVWAVVGIHPHNAIEATEHVLERLASLAGHPHVVGIGETGLDYFHDHSPRIRQQDAFRAHIRLARDLDKALVIHDRDAHADVIEILDHVGAPDRTVFHCFSGDVDMVRHCAERGWFMSFAGNVTFSNAPALREAAAAAPLELMVVETDTPYLSPHPHRGQVNEPARLGVTAELLAEVKSVPVEKFAHATTDNARRLFELPDRSDSG